MIEYNLTCCRLQLKCLCFTLAHISEHPNQQPSHKIQITMGSTEARVDYMGSSILMGIFSNADLKLQDEWNVNLYTPMDTSISDKRYSVIYNPAYIVYLSNMLLIYYMYYHDVLSL